MKFFNTAGPINPEKHSGKTSTMLNLTRQLNKVNNKTITAWGM
jgi:hypothetical protein